MGGTTSACAENTLFSSPMLGKSGNYLRVRGEYLVETGMRFVGLGTTSACAENTRSGRRCGAVTWNYLRVRGEYLLMGGVGSGEVELPPRARRIPSRGRTHPTPMGTTSACAENTHLTAHELP